MTIEPRYCGPPDSGNGGYTAGRLASYLHADEPVAVTLRRPPPLDAAMRVDVHGESVRLFREDDLVAEAEYATFDKTPPPAVDVERALAAQPSYAALIHHPFPTCFVCGTAREVGDGLRLAPGVCAEARTACVWTPDESLVAEGSAGVAAEFVWSALDCPGGWTSDLEARPLVLGRMTASYERLPEVAQTYVVVGALHGIERRKSFTSSALYDPDGVLIARAEHTWIAIDPSRL